MKHISLGGLDVSRIGLGAMTLAGIYTSGGGLGSSGLRSAGSRWAR